MKWRLAQELRKQPKGPKPPSENQYSVFWKMRTDVSACAGGHTWHRTAVFCIAGRTLVDGACNPNISESACAYPMICQNYINTTRIWTDISCMYLKKIHSDMHQHVHWHEIQQSAYPIWHVHMSYTRYYIGLYALVCVYITSSQEQYHHTIMCI